MVQSDVVVLADSNGEEADPFPDAAVPVDADRDVKARFGCGGGGGGAGWWRRRFPPAEWLPKYNFKSDLLPDLVAGITVGITVIPEGMTYAILGNLPPVVSGLFIIKKLS